MSGRIEAVGFLEGVEGVMEEMVSGTVSLGEGAEKPSITDYVCVCKGAERRMIKEVTKSLPGKVHE